MCMLSMVYDYGRQTWPVYPYPNYPNIPSGQLERVPTAEEWAAFSELVEKAKKFDELTNQPDCEDPKKAEWMKTIEQRLIDLETKKCQ